LAHRAHTDTIYAGNKSNQWLGAYQSKRIRAYQIEMNTGLINWCTLAAQKRQLSLLTMPAGWKYKGELERSKVKQKKTKRPKRQPPQGERL